MVESSKISTQKGFKRVLIYCSSHRQLEEIISTLPIIDGYWDAFDYNPQNETCNADKTKCEKNRTKRAKQIKRSVPPVRFALFLECHYNYHITTLYQFAANGLLVGRA